MRWHHKPDPYCAFTDDKERGRTLRSRHRWQAGAFIAMAVIVTGSGAALPFKEVMKWLLRSFL